MRMAGDGSGVVGADLKVLDYDNLYVCDNSVFPTSLAANPSLTLAALALRLAGHTSPSQRHGASGQGALGVGVLLLQQALIRQLVLMGVR